MGRLRLASWAHRWGRITFVFFASALVLAAQDAPALASAPARDPPPHHVVVLPVDGVVDPFMASYVQRGLRAAATAHEDAVVLTIDTPGGLDASMREIVRAILASPVPVICYVPPGGQAASAGAFIMLACPVSGMAPGSSIGAAHPVGVVQALGALGALGVFGASGRDRATNDAAAFIRSLATTQGRDAAWAERAVRDSASADAATAVSMGAADYLAPSLPALLADAARCPPGQAGPASGPSSGPASGPSSGPSSGAERMPGFTAGTCGEPTATFPKTLGEGFFHTFADPNIAFILLDVAFIALLVWAFHPGLHTSLIAGIVCLALGLAILQTLPVRLAGFLLLAVAAVLLVLDVKARAHGVLTAGGVVVLVLGGLLLFNPAVPRARVSPVLLLALPVVLGITSALLLRAVAAAKEEPLHAGVGALAGLVGTAETPLGPGGPRGRVHVHGESWSARAVEGPVAAGAPVRVVGVNGLTLEVVEEPFSPPGATTAWTTPATSEGP